MRFWNRKQERKEEKGGKRRWIMLVLPAAATLMLGGCAMGEATGTKTVAGIAALESGDYAQAQQLFGEAVNDGEQQVLAWRGLGMAYMGLAQYEKAEEAFETALEEATERMPENMQDISLYLATVQYRQEAYEDTIDTCSEILGAAPEGNVDAYFLRGASYLYEGSQEEARKDFDKAASLAPEDYELYLNIFECYRDLNLSGIGGEYLQSALDIQGEEVEDYYNRGRIYFYLEDYTEAQRQLTGPADAKYEPAMYLLGRVYLAQKDYEHAVAMYEKVQKEYGASAESFNGLAACAIERGDYDAALSYISQGLELEGEAGKQELYFNEIVAYERKLDFETAKAKAQEYVNNYPSDAAGQKEWTFLSTR